MIENNKTKALVFATISFVSVLLFPYFFLLNYFPEFFNDGYFIVFGLITLLLAEKITTFFYRQYKENRMPKDSFLIAKYQGSSTLKTGETYIIGIIISFPQTVSLKVLLSEEWLGHWKYNTLAEFFDEWIPLKIKSEDSKVYLGGEFEFDTIPMFKKKRNITNYDSSISIYLRYLFERYLEDHQSSRKFLHDRISEIGGKGW